jgi:hypothetical protein
MNLNAADNDLHLAQLLYKKWTGRGIQDDTDRQLVVMLAIFSKLDSIDATLAKR